MVHQLTDLQEAVSSQFGVYLRVMGQHIVHIGLTHAADPVGYGIELPFLSAEHFIDHAFYAGFAHHANVHRILREYIFQ